ncbi:MULTISPECIES: hypothetical protein [Sutcliffiella]|uniref:Solute-binding protein family 5 domain-containing protein n=1 Tax=Sutcliffiella cohnii TaxID=33932 RepID=A0A223KNH5_9BACI|nr:MULTISPECIES: hypothetical protein [Sutcliffiella]AST90914.1 hypothetical protein BC6307_06270 [Sutcliffiella cohnii]WBL16702.1 hypothetical protein O1A01_08755 [Sutcliffiella sp. NC1]
MTVELGGSRHSPAYGIVPTERNRNTSPHLHNVLLTEMRITIGVLNFPSLVADIEWVKTRAKEKGVIVEVIPVELSTIYDVDSLLTFDAFYTGETFENNLFSSLLVFYYGQNSVLRNYISSDWKAMLDSEYAQIMAMETKEESTLLARIRSIETQLVEHKLLIFTYHTSEKQTFRSYLNGIAISGLGWPNFQRIWFEKNSNNSMYWK